MRIYHNSRKTEYRNPFGAAETGTVVRIAIDVEHEVAEEPEVKLRLWHNDGEHYVPMRTADGRRYETQIRMPSGGGLLWYCFVVDAGGELAYYGNNAERLGGEGRMYSQYDGYSIEGIPSYQITVYRADPEARIPEWYTQGIVYQIFPDRFARDEGWLDRCKTATFERDAKLLSGRLRNQNRPEPQHQYIVLDWNEKPSYDRSDRGAVTDWGFYGGSLRGIEEKLGYIVSLGVTAIYLNPIFEAVSNHRYDTADYMRIDPRLGTEDDLRSLCAHAAELGISIILDGVFNHTGADSRYFDLYGNYGGRGAYGNPDSPYRDWYEFCEAKSDGPDYRAWWGVADLPEINEDAPTYRQMICGPGGVLAKWQDAGVKGWRLDVADELPDDFISDIRHTVKAEPDTLLIGEVWEDASNKVSYGVQRQYLMGDELDGTMNYPLRDILLDYINYTITSGNAANRIMNLAENYPRNNFYAALNLIGSHDKERILTLMAAAEDYDAAVRKVRMLAVLQFCLPGVPCIYYGDEAGLMGGRDPENRAGFPWGREDAGLQEFFRRLGSYYNNHPVLKDGELEMLSGTDAGIPDDVLAFIRRRDTESGEQILVMTNRSYLGNNFTIDRFPEMKTIHMEPLETKLLIVSKVK